MADLDETAGSASAGAKAAVRAALANTRRAGDTGFAGAVGARLALAAVDVSGPKRARVVLECVVEEDMLNLVGILHGGCVAFLIGTCAILPAAALAFERTGRAAPPGASQSANIVFHAPALLNTRLRITGEALAAGARTSTSTCQIWDVKNDRLVASSVHVDVHERAPPPTAKL